MWDSLTQGIENKGWGVKQILKPSQAEHFRLKSCFLTNTIKNVYYTFNKYSYKQSDYI